MSNLLIQYALESGPKDWKKIPILNSPLLFPSLVGMLGSGRCALKAQGWMLIGHVVSKYPKGQTSVKVLGIILGVSISFGTIEDSPRYELGPPVFRCVSSQAFPSESSLLRSGLVVLLGNTNIDLEGPDPPHLLLGIGLI